MDTSSREVFQHAGKLVADRNGVYIEKTDPEARQRAHRPQGIPGWGADLAAEDRPGVPMERTPPRLAAIPPLEAQRSTVRVLHSKERPGLTPVYGTTAPPSGLSGSMRELAFRYSENDLRHWLVLLAADRVNVGEGLLSDLAHGHIPNVFREMGGPAEWKYNRAGFVRKAAVVAGGIALIVYLMRRSRDRS